MKVHNRDRRKLKREWYYFNKYSRAGNKRKMSEYARKLVETYNRLGIRPRKRSAS